MVRSGSRGHHHFTQRPQSAGRPGSAIVHYALLEQTALAPEGSARHLRPRPSAWQRAFDALRGSVWPMILASVCAAGLLLAFQQVVRAGVLQGEARNRATAAHSRAVWACNFMRSTSQRASCNAQLNAERLAGATLNSPHGAAPVAAVLAAR